jgi:hypothetical protein
MITRRHSCFALAAAGVLSCTLAAQVDDDPAAVIKNKLEDAKDAYKAAADTFQQSVAAYLDKREEAARKDGNKKLVDQLNEERSAFERKGELPPSLPPGIRQELTGARPALDRAYQAAVKDYVRIKLDQDADRTEKARQQLVVASALQAGTFTYLATLKHTDVKVAFDKFTTNGTDRYGKPIKRNGVPAPHSLFMHPPNKGASHVSYALGGKWAVFHASYGIPKFQPDDQQHKSAITFEVVGDGKPLWKSDPVGKADEFRACDVLIERVKTLTLRGSVTGKAEFTRAVWFDPLLIEP